MQLGYCFDVRSADVIALRCQHWLPWLLHYAWPLCRQCEIPWRFPDGSRHSSVALSMLSVTHIMPVLVLLSVVGVGMQSNSAWPETMYLTMNRLLLNTFMDTNMQFTINWFRQLFPDNSLIFSKIPDISLTTVIFPDISRFSRQVVTLCVANTKRLCWC